MAGLGRALLLCVSVMAGADSALAQAQLSERPAAAAAASPARLPGYLAPGAAPDAALFLPPAPTPGSPTDVADVDAFRRTRGLEGSARWRLATADAALPPSALMADFGCALGVRVDPPTAPALARLIGRMGRDAGAAAAHVKQVYRRPRPFVTYGGPICVPRDRELAESFSYPSGHSTYGWSVGLALAELAPERASAVLARARSFGESRVVCGVHYVSDVEQGRSVASGVVAVLHADPGFQADLALARAEIAAARSRGAVPDPGQCRAEAAALARPLISPVPATPVGPR